MSQSAIPHNPQFRTIRNSIYYMHYRYSLDTSSKKYTCPKCREKTFVLYVDTQTGRPLNEASGRCDRENNCAYEMPPREYLAATGVNPEPRDEEITLVAEEQPADYLPSNYVDLSMNGYEQTNLAKNFIKLFPSAAQYTLLKYQVGRSKIDNGAASIYFQIDKDLRVRTGKIMSYHPYLFKRNKDISPTWVHNVIPKFNFKQCFFGEHLLNNNANPKIAVIEGEKSALVCSLYFPQYTWLATGGANGCKWREYSVHKVFEGREVTMFPDFGFYNRQSGKTCFEEWTDRAASIMERVKCLITVSSVLENNLPDEERINDVDLADILIKSDESGRVITDDGYPAIWDMPNSHRCNISLKDTPITDTSLNKM